MLHALTDLIIANNAETSLRYYTNMDDKVPVVTVTALLILQRFGSAITDSANAGEGSTLDLPINAVKVSSRVKFSNIFMILNE